jgi:hypothetical protein
MENILRRSRATKQQFCLCNTCNGKVLMSYAGRKRHKNENGLSIARPARLVPEDPDEEDEEDEEGARAKVIAEQVLRDLLAQSDDDDVDLLDSHSPISTPPMSQFGDDEQQLEGPRVDGGYTGPDAAMDTTPGVLAEELDANTVKWVIKKWVEGAALLISTWCLPYAVFRNILSLRIGVRFKVDICLPHS